MQSKKNISTLVNFNFAASSKFEAGTQTIKLCEHLLNNVIKINSPQHLENKRHGIFEFAIRELQLHILPHFSPVVLS